MFRFVGVGDIHIHLRKDVPMDWQVGRYTQFFKQLIAECKRRDAALLVAGDTLHSVEPSSEELELFFTFLHDLLEEGIDTYMVSGNHETISTGKSILDRLVVSRFPNVTYRPALQPVVSTSGVALHLVNHDSLHTHKPELDSRFNLLLSHFRCNINQFIREEIDVTAFTEGFNLTVAGDIHSPVQFGHVVYTNCPVNDKFEAAPNCGFIYGEIDGLKYYVERIKSDAPQLVQTACFAEDFADLTFCDKNFYRVEVTGTPADLRLVKSPAKNVKLDKIPLVEAALVVDEDTATLKEIETISGTVEDELEHYLKLAGYQDQKIADMMSALKEYAV